MVVYEDSMHVYFNNNHSITIIHTIQMESDVGLQNHKIIEVNNMIIDNITHMSHYCLILDVSYILGVPVTHKLNYRSSVSKIYQQSRVTFLTVNNVAP